MPQHPDQEKLNKIDNLARIICEKIKEKETVLADSLEQSSRKMPQIDFSKYRPITTKKSVPTTVIAPSSIIMSHNHHVKMPELMSSSSTKPVESPRIIKRAKIK